MKLTCELCTNEARIFCDSDEARLCWDCDEKVHSANFLVAKHCRSLLCHVCQTPTPWKASGPKLGRPTISECGNCFHDNESCKINQRKRLREEEEQEEKNDEVSSSDSENSSEDDYSSCSDDEDEDEDEDADENQVVPWSDSSSPQAPVVSISSSSEDHCDPIPFTAAYLHSDDEDGCSSKLNHNATTMECEMPSSSSLRPLKIARTRDLIQQIEAQISKPLGIVDHYY